ncbi:MAG TPA: type II toxin-antitoxin system HicB family antitoxin [Phycisphaerae bacterium]|nr:type II toxin-antitoxin system HicB family antitoxin [Phycisphaerae bacterium]
MVRRTFTAAIHKEGDIYVALCPELDIASQGETIETARQNLREAIELFLETAGRQEIAERLHGEVYLSSLEVTIG